MLPRVTKRDADAAIFGKSKRAEEATAEDPRAKKRQRRRKKIRYPKGFDPQNPGPMPDPERWLPKRERSTYRLRKRDKRAGISRGPQVISCCVSCVVYRLSLVACCL